jgi:adenosylhomocysteine nucleosidase
MPLGWLLRDWLQKAAAQRLREAVAQAAGQQAGPREPPSEPGRVLAMGTCDVGLVFATEIESGGLEDLLHGVVSIRGEGFVARQAWQQGRSLVLVRCGAGRQAAADATEALILGHRPRCVISAGFAGGLQAALARHDLVVADDLVDGDGRRLAIEPPIDRRLLPEGPPLSVGRLLTVDRVVHQPREKKELGEKHQALAVDMESFDVARVCRERNVPMLAVRVITDAVDEELPRDMERLARQKTSAARWGAALGTLWNRPSSIKDLWALQEKALIGTDRLGRFLLAMIEQMIVKNEKREMKNGE